MLDHDATPDWAHDRERGLQPLPGRHRVRIHGAAQRADQQGALWSSTASRIEAQYISFDDTTLYLSGGRRFTRGRNNVQLRYTAGFDDIPVDLAQVCVETVGLRWRERDRIGHTSKSLQGETVSFTLADFSPSGQTVIDSYKRTAPV
jgi:hypothetical protein